MSQSRQRHPYPHPAHPAPDHFSLEELAAWDAELLVWAVREGYWRANPFEPTFEGALRRGNFIENYTALGFAGSFLDHHVGQVLLHIGQIMWPAVGEAEAETQLRLAYLHAEFDHQINRPPAYGDFTALRFAYQRPDGRLSRLSEAT